MKSFIFFVCLLYIQSSFANPNIICVGLFYDGNWIGSGHAVTKEQGSNGMKLQSAATLIVDTRTSQALCSGRANDGSHVIGQSHIEFFDSSNDPDPNIDCTFPKEVPHKVLFQKSIDQTPGLWSEISMKDARVLSYSPTVEEEKEWTSGTHEDLVNSCRAKCSSLMPGVKFGGQSFRIRFDPEIYVLQIN